MNRVAKLKDSQFVEWLRAAVATHFPIRRNRREDEAAVRESGLFDPSWYQRQLTQSGAKRDLIADYVRQGHRRGLEPHPLFDSNYYRDRQKVKEFTPLGHYHLFGGREDCDPSPWFHSKWYRTQLPNYPQGISPLLHFCTVGVHGGLSPHPLFELDWYMAKYGGYLAHANPLADYVQFGSSAGRLPHRAFIASDVGACDVNELVAAAMARCSPSEGPKVERLSPSYELPSELGASRASVRLSGPREPLVSVVMATKDRAYKVDQAIESVLAQKYRQWELIVVDDASVDCTSRIIEHYMSRDNRILYARLGHTAGVAGARNIGVNLSVGGYIAYLDSDNTWSEDFLDVMVGTAEESGADLLYSGAEYVSNTGSSARYFPFSWKEFASKRVIEINACLHKRSIVAGPHYFDEEFPRMSDWEFLLRASRGADVRGVRFVGVQVDEMKTHQDRVSVREPGYWRYVIQNIHMIDWASAAAARSTEFVSIVIPVFNQFALTNDCLHSILSNTPDDIPFEIILVDNGSNQYTHANLRLWELNHQNIRLVRNEDNLHFATACNQGFAEARGGIIVFLNNDTRVLAGWLEPLRRELRNPTVGAVQPKMLYPDGTVQSIGAVFSEHATISYPLYRGEPGAAAYVNRRRVLPALHGACLAVRSTDFAKLRGFDPRFVDGQEDVDLCLRMNALAGLWCVVEPSAVVIHLEGRTRGVSANMRQNRRLFVNRWRGRVPAQDSTFYNADGFDVVGWRSDGPKLADEGIGVLCPVLKPRNALDDLPSPEAAKVVRRGRGE